MERVNEGKSFVFAIHIYKKDFSNGISTHQKVRYNMIKSREEVFLLSLESKLMSKHFAFYFVSQERLGTEEA